MSNQDIIRAWKDEDYRLSLSAAERALLPQHPAGLIELAGAELDSVEGGRPDVWGTFSSQAEQDDLALFRPRK
jgi:mersacidin/lichenicidin family type 2 lantibiotic